MIPLLHLYVNDKKVKAYKINRIVIAWLLSAVLMLPILAKTIHVYQNKCCEEQCGHSDRHHSDHDCNTCSICQFTFYSFIEADLSHAGALLPGFYCPQFVEDEEKGYCSIVPVGFLRAPPFA